MRTRAYRPEAPRSLEDRSLLSGFGGPAADPVVMTSRQLDTILEQVRLNFQLYAENGNVPRLREQLQIAVKNVPFGRIDGLGISFNAIVQRMRRELNARQLFHPVAQASNRAVAAVNVEVQNRVASGDLVVD
ncbi:hypothetical protein [Singulisphaera sp. PoT]|uniref:hypothetical protein n=1 Tax=Singulisphaera sp. PoT TaxID=3411797 RepID=UPI003BF4DA3F